MDGNFFVRVPRQSFVIIKFVTDIFVNNTSSIVVAIIKLISVTYACTMSSALISNIDVLEIYNKEGCSNSFIWRLPKLLGPFKIICQYMN